MAVKDNEEEEFLEELDTFNIRMPGNKDIPFSENQIFLQMTEQQYPRWKDPGKITSVPVAKVPKMFLHGSQLEKLLQKQLRSVFAGDEGEMKLYRLLINESFPGEPGVIVFPNVDGSHIFKCQAGRVEIDMVLIHSKKGIFVFNVKNQGRKGTPGKKVEEDIEKHSKFVRMLKNYKSPEDNCFTPIHTVICDFRNEKTKFGNFETINENTGENIIVLNKKDLETANFVRTWVSRIAKISDVVWDTSLDVLVARLIALASIEGATSLIHEKVTTGVLQSTIKKDNLEFQLGFFGNNHKLKEIVAEHSEIENRRRKKRFILWTKAQMAVIAKVFNHVTTSQKHGLRLLVTGGRGTGKTMLLVLLAKMVQSIREFQTGERTSRTMVMEGTQRAKGLIAVLKQALHSSNITFLEDSGEIIWMFLFKRCSSQWIQKVKILLIKNGSLIILKAIALKHFWFFCLKLMPCRSFQLSCERSKGLTFTQGRSMHEVYLSTFTNSTPNQPQQKASLHCKIDACKITLKHR